MATKRPSRLAFSSSSSSRTTTPHPTASSSRSSSRSSFTTGTFSSTNTRRHHRLQSPFKRRRTFYIGPAERSMVHRVLFMPGLDVHLLLDAIKTTSTHTSSVISDNITNINTNTNVNIPNTNVSQSTSFSEEEKEVMVETYVHNMYQYADHVNNNDDEIKDAIFDVRSIHFDAERALNASLEQNGVVKMPILSKPWKNLRMWQEKVLGQCQ